MSTMVHVTTEVVKKFFDNASCQPSVQCNVAFVNLLERIEWIMAHFGLSSRELSEKAGLSSTHVGTLVGRLLDIPTHRNIIPHIPTVSNKSTG